MQEPARNLLHDINPVNNNFNNERDNRNFSINFCFSFALVIFIISYLGRNFSSNYSKIISNPNCDLIDPENRSFNRFYGISHNYFEEFNGENSGIPIYKPIIPDQILKSLSFICVAPVGSGKTLIRKHYTSLRKSKIMILNHQVSEILKIFLTNLEKENKDTSPQIIIEKNWEERDYEHTLLFYFSKNLLKKYSKNVEEFRKIFRNISKQEYKYDLFLIMMIFSNDNNKEPFENFIKDLWASFKPENLNGLAQNNNIMKLLDKIEELQLDPSFNLNPDKISIFIEFYKKYLKQKPTIIIDSLDESDYFLNRTSREKPALKTFISSTFSQKILTRVYDMTLEIIYFFPKFEGLDIYNMVEKKDKIPIVELQWNKPQLKNYGDFVIKSMSLKQLNPCQKLPNFHDLVDYEKNSDTIDLLETPRQINIFMRFLIEELNSQSEINRFKVTKEDVKKAYERAKNSIKKYY